MWQKTQVGRIVYDRKIHLFGLKDAVRICKKTGATLVEVSIEDYVVILEFIKGLLGVDDPNFGFAGGTFGGGGTTRPFSERLGAKSKESIGEALTGATFFYIKESD